MLGFVGNSLRALGQFLPAVSSVRVPASLFCTRNSSTWSVEKDPHPLPRAEDIIKEHEIFEAIKSTVNDAKNPRRIDEILKNALDHALSPTGDKEYVQGLTLEEAATLLNIDSKDSDMLGKLTDTAFKIKNRIYGNRIVLFAPVYVSNYCVNSCTYCAFRTESGHSREMLTNEQLVEEVKALQQQGHRRLLLLTGESPMYPFSRFLNAVVKTSQVTTPPHGKIRRINVEIPALSISDFKRLKATGVVGTYTLFQETYHKESFAKFHPRGPKADFANRVTTMDRAQIAGVDDVGIGALFGLFDYRFEVLAMLQHSLHLDKTYNAGPHTISIPRMQFAADAPTAQAPPYPVTDNDFKKLVATLRCAVPYTGMILSTRESAEMRRMCLQLGVSQMSAGSRTHVGGYHRGGELEAAEARAKAAAENASGQFELQDTRSLAEVVDDLIGDGFVPSWCTACYRTGRTGSHFMSFAKRGEIHNYCHPNALLTLEEFAVDYGSPRTKKLVADLLAKELPSITDSRRRKAFLKKLQQIRSGTRDLYF